MLSECAWGVSRVGEVKPSRWVYIMNLIGILASKWKYLWYLHLEYTLCTHLKSIKDWNCCTYKYLEPWNSFIVMFTDALIFWNIKLFLLIFHFFQWSGGHSVCRGLKPRCWQRTDTKHTFTALPKYSWARYQSPKIAHVLALRWAGDSHILPFACIQLG